MSEALRSSVAGLRDRIARAGRDPDTVTLVAVTKGFGLDVVLDALGSGLVDLGENYAQDLHSKADALDAAQRAAVRWHFIGRLQTNKTRAVAEAFQWVHTVDRDKIARRLNEQRPQHAPPLNVLIQVNQANEPQKAGVAPRDVAPLARAIRALPRLELRGLMTVPPAEDSSEHWFAELAALRRALAADGIELDTLSMGMSADFEAAIAAGSNCVRIGTAIFGARR